MKDLYQKIYAEVKKIPLGKVSTYGAIAKQIGLKRYARHVGFALNALKSQADVPWQRVINSQGKISSRKDDVSHHIQRQMLEQEGIVFSPAGRVNLKLFLWQA